MEFVKTTDYSLTERPNYLRLHGGPYNLSVPASPTMFLRKQTHSDGRRQVRSSMRTFSIPSNLHLRVRKFISPGDWSMEFVFLGRETFLVPLEWKDDWPVINGGQKISLNSHGPGQETGVWNS
jgi:beta-xylosidase